MPPNEVVVAYKALGNLNGMLTGYNDPRRHPLPLDEAPPPPPPQ
jgi:hypothetical protein